MFTIQSFLNGVSVVASILLAVGLTTHILAKYIK